MPKLSIIILNHNTSKLLKQCLSSITAHDDYQIIVVDAGSTDNSVTMVKKNFPSVVLIASPTNPGFTRGNNLARNKAQGDYVLFLNSDTQMFPNTLPEMLRLMASDAKIGIATCLVKLPSGKLYYGCHRGFPSPWNSLTYFTGLAKLFPQSKLFAGYTATYLPLNEIHEIDACSGTFLLIRHSLLDQINWFDEDYFAYGEDLQMCFNVKKKGYKVVFDPHAKLIHYWGATSGLTKTSQKTPDLKWSQARYEAMKIFYDKNYRQSYPQFMRNLVFSAIDFVSKTRKYSD
ncbi:MAG: Glycosyl transferase family 2 [Microgenomates group bacterium GW2011_GWA1_48_10]|uniref:Glycosyltransferase 2-like domain-containing protein n=1 Tax=Candidatus Gottesmanbacteria bacterium RIFCSPHIGHO2_01_FULL_47_48 TaxID=1798381 RepID=A0A1F6A3Z7_9BACT|nr:MAG: Glycosyl transferase family 2 [Microgenomates group bacterium GW2011_GWA1_48_10]OGG19152.1 MAG: hypothetical protein A2721_01905 [Candidatus Gottesmanbacteria bacterium RIFCSPHIGHO2_01_FULL_47_48]